MKKRFIMNLRNFYLNLILKEKKNFFELLVFLFLKILSLFYLCGLLLKNFLDNLKQKKEYKNKKIISIGNLTWGGTGKTSFTIYLLKILKDINKKAVVIQRGYPKNFKNPVEVLEEDTEKYTDEGILIKKTFPEIPVYLCKNRIKAIEKAIKEKNFEYIILDDAFQYKKIKKDIEFLMIDSSNPFGNGNLIPAGILREPVSSLKKASVIVLTHSEISQFHEIVKYTKFNKKIDFFHLYYKIKNLEELKLIKAEFGAFCGIGNPESFFKLLEKEGFILKEKIIFPDHYDYKKLNLNKNLIWFTTEKDFVKLKNTKHNIKEVKIEICLKEEEKLKQLFLTETAHLIKTQDT